MPFVMSGNFAYVFKLHLPHGGACAVKCFRRFLGDRGQRYEAMSQYLDKSPLACVADFEYDAQGILVEGHRYPTLVMEWVDGPTLDVYISQLLKTGEQSNALMSLAAEWAQIVLALEQGGVAHGDLQHGNIIVTTQGLRLVDLDGMFVPTLVNAGAADEIGHRHYQHPLRSASDFNSQIDRFSSLVIYTSILGIAVDASLWREFHDDNLILTKADFQNPDSSDALRRMRSMGGEVSRLTEAVIAACRQPLHAVPALSGLITVTRNTLPIWIRQPAVVPVPSASRESMAPPPPAHTAGEFAKPISAHGPSPAMSATTANTPSHQPIIAGRRSHFAWMLDGFKEGLGTALVLSFITAPLVQSFVPIVAIGGFIVGMVSAYKKRGGAAASLSPAGSSSTASPNAPRPSSSSSASASVVGSRIRFIYHASSCEWALKITARNRVYFSSSGEASQKGYRACRVCRP